MSGFSTTVFFKDNFNINNLINVLDLIKVRYHLSDDEKNCYDIYIQNEIDNKFGVYEIEKIATIHYYNPENAHLDYSLSKSFWDEINTIDEEFTFFISIFYMRSNAHTNNHMLKILESLKKVSRFYFINQNLKSDIIDQYVISQINSLNEVFLISSDSIPIIAKNEKSIKLLGIS